MTRRFSLAATLLLAGSLAVTAGPAQAVTFNHDDAVGDVRSLDDGSEAVDAEPQPLERRADVTQLRVRHGKSRLIMRVEIADLTRRDSRFLGPIFEVRTPKRRYSVDLLVENTRRGADRDVFLSGPRRGVRCDGIFADLDFEGDVAIVSVPRRCLGNPRTVRVGAGMVHVPRGGGRILADDAQRDGTIRDDLVLSEPIRSGPRR